MGRDNIGERTIADPRLRAADKAHKKAKASATRLREQRSLAAFLERAKWCRAKGCENPAKTGDDGWWPCCSEACFLRWNDSLT